MNPITVRTMKFDFPDAHEFHPICIAGSSMLSYTHLGLGLLFSYVEPFIVKSIRKVIDQIQDEELKDQADRFVRQETQHYQRHREFNKLVFSHGYPGLEERCERLNKDYETFYNDKSSQFCVGYLEGFESYTTQAALQSLASGLYDHRKNIPALGDLFKWHMLEEIEHRNVAFDIYESLYGGYAYRTRMCLFAQNHMFRFVNDCVALMSSKDIERYGKKSAITARQNIRVKMNRFGIRIRTMLPGYTPHQYVIPDKLRLLAEHYTQTAQSTR